MANLRGLANERSLAKATSGQNAAQYDIVEAPEHYCRFKISPIEVIVDWELDFIRGSVIKYIARAKYKGAELQDLKKAAKWLSMAIELLEKGELKETISNARSSTKSDRNQAKL